MQFTFVLLSVTTYVLASKGDQSPLFQSCLILCKQKTHSTFTPNIFLKLTGWNYTDECKYQCTHEITNLNIFDGKNIDQFYGKWPFIRFLGIQEPASVLFSILNLLGHLKGTLRYYIHRRSYQKYNPIFIYYGFSAVNAWFWSSIFHSRDLKFTEKMDYFSSTFFNLFGIIIGLEVGLRGKFKSIITKITSFGVVVYFIAHCAYLCYKFDYGLNMIANVIVGCLQGIIWMVWIAQNSKRWYAWKIVLVVSLMIFGMSFELFDFPPLWGIFDAHSIWHLTTIPVSRLFWDFVGNDARYNDYKKIN